MCECVSVWVCGSVSGRPILLLFHLQPPSAFPVRPETSANVSVSIDIGWFRRSGAPSLDRSAQLKDHRLDGRQKMTRFLRTGWLRKLMAGLMKRILAVSQSQLDMRVMLSSYVAGAQRWLTLARLDNNRWNYEVDGIKWRGGEWGTAGGWGGGGGG